MKAIYIYHVYPGTRSLAFGFLVCCSIAVYVSCSTTLEAGPESQIVVEGQRVSLICDLNDDNDKSILWAYLTGPGWRRYISLNDKIFQSSGHTVDVNNYEILIDSQRQTYELVLKVANIMSDTGTYECGFEYGPARKYSVLASAKLTVLQMSDSQECELTLLPMLGEISDQDVQITCSWSHTQAAQVYFRDSNGQVIEPEIAQTDRVISRVSYGKVPDVTCMVTLSTNETIDTPCVGNSATNGVVRVDPFVSEVYVGSSASFTCVTSDSDINMSWDVLSADGTSIVNDGTVVQSGSELTITNVDTASHSTIVECKNQIKTNFSVSSFAVLQIIEATTPIFKRPPGESQSNGSTPSTTTADNYIGATLPVNPAGNNSTIIIIAIIIIVIIIVVLLIVIFFLVRRRKSNSHKRRLSSNDHAYNTVEYRDIPHITHSGSSQVYAISFKDKKSKSRQRPALPKFNFSVADADNVSPPCEVLNLQPSASGDQIYAEPDVMPGRTGSEHNSQFPLSNRCLSMPVLDVNEYETMSDPAQASKEKAKTLSALSASSDRIGGMGQRGTSQRLKKDGPWTPPTVRHAVSLRRPTKKNPTLSADYTPMTISNSDIPVAAKSPKKTPVYAKPDKASVRGRLGVTASGTHVDKPQDVAKNDKFDYADIEAVSGPRDDDLLDTYLSSVPVSLGSSLPDHMKKNKATSLKREPSNRSAPPKPLRGKCQSELLMTSAYSVISDYEIMSQQVKETADDGTGDYDECDDTPASFLPVSAYDDVPKRGHTLPRLNEYAPASPHQGNVNGGGGRRVKSLDQNQYELIGDERREMSLTTPLSPHYADISDGAYALVSDNGVCASEWQSPVDGGDFD